MYRSNRSFNIPPPGIPRAFDTFAVPGRREFDYQSLPGCGEFDPHAKGVGNLNRSLDFMWNLWALCTWRAIMAGTQCTSNVDCILTDWQVNEVNIVVKYSNRFPIPKLNFKKTQSLRTGNRLKHFRTTFTLFTCKYASLQPPFVAHLLPRMYVY